MQKTYFNKNQSELEESIKRSWCFPTKPFSSPLYFGPTSRSWDADKTLCVICRDGTVCQARRSSHTGLRDPQWSNSQYARSAEFSHYENDSQRSFCSCPLKTEWALVSLQGFTPEFWLLFAMPGFVKIRVLPSLHLNTLREKRDFRIRRLCDCVNFRNSEIPKEKRRSAFANCHHTHNHTHTDK